MRAAVAVVTTLPLAQLATGCGGSSRSPVAQLGATTTQSSPSSTTQHGGAVAFARCMRTHGVTSWPDPTSSGVFHQAQLQQARTQALSFSRCIRSHGLPNFPDPGSDGRIPDPATVGIDQGSPTFQAANTACRSHRPPYIPSNAAYDSWAKSQG